MEDNNSKYNILLVDDDKVVCNMLKRFITSMGFNVITAFDGAAGLLKLKTEAVHLVITDLGLPGIDGFELFLKCKELFPELKVIFITGFGHNYEPKIKEAIQNGLYCCLYKPFKYNALEKAIKSALK